MNTNQESGHSDKIMRAKLATQFLQNAGWGNAKRQALTADASTRSYERVELNGKTALLMNAPQNLEAALCPPHATPEERKALGYNASARLAGSDMIAFKAIADGLTAHSLSAPIIYDMNASEGFALIEDLGDDLYAEHLKKTPRAEKALYENAALVLVHIAKQNIVPEKPYEILTYDETAMMAEVHLLTQYYWREKNNTPLSQAIMEEYDSLWQGLLRQLSSPSVLVLRDYHAENLLWLPDRKGRARTGLIDFQDGLIGHKPYDLVSLLEDARRDVTPDLVPHILNFYCDALAMDGHMREQFDFEYALLGAQRNAKILGIFVRLARRDGKMRYLDLLPRVEGHFRNNLTAPGLEPLKQFFNTHFPELFV